MERMELPADLTEWVASPELAALVSRVAHAVDDAELDPAFSFDDARFYSPWALLGLLTYAYAAGVYRSDLVAALSQQEANLHWLCHGECPEAPLLQRFRAKNRAVLQEVLTRVLRVVLDQRPGGPPLHRTGDGCGVTTEQSDWREAILARWLAEEAQMRVHRAEREDQSLTEKAKP